MTELETASDPAGLRRVAIDPLTRVEGHGKVTLLLDADNRVQQARLHIVEFRGFEKFIQGRPYWEVPVMVQRLCGICPVSHQIAASKALDAVVGAHRLPPAAEKLRRLMHYGQILQSHALHFFHLASPDLLFGADSDPARRNLAGLVAQHPELARQGILLRKFGQRVIEAVAGKRIHGTGAIPGGVNKALTPSERKALLADAEPAIAWARDALALLHRLHQHDPDLYDERSATPSPLMSLVGADGALDLYDGKLRVRDAAGNILLDGIEGRDYARHIAEQVKPWSYMKFPFLKSLGKEAGWYKVGPLARVQNCDFIPTPLAEQERQRLRAHAGGNLLHAPLAYHWARLIELLHCAEQLRDWLQDPDLLGGELTASGEGRLEGIGILEAPRGTLIHHYQVDEHDLVSMANLIVSTTHNNQAMNEAIRAVASREFDGRAVTEGMLNRIELAIRAFDPCLSCATHALGKMPLEVELHDTSGALISKLARHGDGSLS
jgi:NAD-reducing hydrogenase large subunit